MTAHTQRAISAARAILGDVFDDDDPEHIATVAAIIDDKAGIPALLKVLDEARSVLEMLGAKKRGTTFHPTYVAVDAALKGKRS